LIVYTLRNRKIPFAQAGSLGLIFFLLFGLLGQIRKSSTYTGGDFSWNKIEYVIDENIDYAIEETEKWASLGAEIATYYAVPEKVDFLYGKSYMAFLAFWVPRVVWPGKPHGVGYYTGRVIFGGSSGIPPSSAAEAYWNFNLFGVIIIPFLGGMLIRFFTNLYLYNFYHPGIVALYSIILVTGVTLTSLALTGLVQTLLFALIFLRYLKLI